MVVRYARCEVDRQDIRGKKVVSTWEQTRIRVSHPKTYGTEQFEKWKRIVKGTGFSEYCKSKKRGQFWHIPATALSLVECATAIRKAYPGAKQYLDEFCDKIRKPPTSVHDVKIRDLPRAIMKPWDHQRVGSHLVGQLSGVMLAYDMGCGKTKTVYDAIVEYGFKKTFVVCPANVIEVWNREARKHIPPGESLVVMPLDKRNSCAERRDLIKAGLEESDSTGIGIIAVINYEAIASPHGKCIRDLVSEHDWDLVVADECHRAANSSSNTGKFFRRMVHRAAHRVGLSGTPLGNGPQDAFGQFCFVDPGLFGEFVTRFRSRYLVMGGWEGKQVLDYQNEQEFRDRMARLTVVVKLRDVVDLPPERDEERLISLDPPTAKVYRDLRDEFIADWKDGVIVGDNILVRLTRLAQITSGFSKAKNEETGKESLVEIGTEKTRAVMEILDDLEPNEPVVVFCRFVHDLHEVKRACLLLGSPAGSRQRRSYLMGGGRSELKEWEESCDRGEGPVIAVQLKAGGVGIDLTRACYGIYYSIGFEPIDYRQSRARIMRPGQTRSVIYYHLIVPGTVDRLIYRAQSKKRSVVDSVIDDLVNARDLV
jgi:SNF2 family DNA or RNA helicase